MNNAHYKIVDLFGNEEVRLVTNKKNSPQTSLTDYDGFVEKFVAKKTTDDCYTPAKIYNTILKFVNEKFELKGYNIIRPFYPDGDYENINYGINDIVIDNPPFSIVSQIAKFYIKKGIKFFIFAPHFVLTVSSVQKMVDRGIDFSVKKKPHQTY